MTTPILPTYPQIEKLARENGLDGGLVVTLLPDVWIQPARWGRHNANVAGHRVQLLVDGSAVVDIDTEAQPVNEYALAAHLCLMHPGLATHARLVERAEDYRSRANDAILVNGETWLTRELPRPDTESWTVRRNREAMI